MKQHGFTLSEIFLWMAIAVVLATILTGCGYKSRDGMGETYKGVSACQPRCPVTNW